MSASVTGTSEPERGPAATGARPSALASLTWDHLIVVCLVVLAAVVLLVQHARIADGYMPDDAFISFRYAANLADGHGPVWHPGDRVEGYTNFGWVLLVGLFDKGGVDPVDSSRAIGLVASLGTLALVPVIAAQLRPAWSTRWWILVSGALFALAVSNPFALWTLAGLEAPAFAFLITAAAAAHLVEERHERIQPASALLLVAATLMRPDGVVILALIWAFKAMTVYRARDRDTLLRFAGWSATFIVLYGVYWLWRWNYYGDFFPNTYYLKTSHTQEFFERGAEYVWQFITIHWIWLALAAAVSVWRERTSRVRPALFLTAFLTVWLLYGVTTGGDWMPYFRFLVPVLPVAYILITHSLVDVVDVVGEKFHAAPRLRHAASGLVIGVFVVAAAVPTDDATARNPAKFPVQPRAPLGVDLPRHRAIGEWLQQNVPPDHTVALGAAGAVPYYSRLPTLDMSGLNDRHIAHLQARDGLHAPGHDKFDPGYVIAERPAIIWLLTTLDPAPRESFEDYDELRWFPRLIPLLDHPALRSEYRPFSVQLEGGWLNIFVRRDVDAPALAP